MPLQAFALVVSPRLRSRHLGILLETTLNLEPPLCGVTYLEVKLCCDLFTTLVRSTTSYACEVWVDSKKIKAIEVVYQGFLKFLLRVQKITSTSIVLAEFGKFPFEHFAWGQTLLYCNRVSTVTKNCILGKAWEAQLAMLATGKKCWVGSMKKWLLKN